MTIGHAEQPSVDQEDRAEYHCDRQYLTGLDETRLIALICGRVWHKLESV